MSKKNADFTVDLDSAPEPEAVALAPPPVEAAKEVSSGPTREEIDRIRATRQPLAGGVGRLHVHGSLPGYHLHIFKDEGTRIAMALQAGYAFVQRGEGSIQMGRDVASIDNDPGSRIRVVMGSKGTEPMYGYLMKIPEELYNEDMARQEAEVEAVDRQIQGGQIGETTDQQRYVPKAGVQYDPRAAKFLQPPPK